MLTHPSPVVLGEIVRQLSRPPCVATVWRWGRLALILVVIIKCDQCSNSRQKTVFWASAQQDVIDAGIKGSWRAERRQLLSWNAEAWVSVLERKEGKEHVRQRKNLGKGLEWKRNWLARAAIIRLLSWSSVVGGGERIERWVGKGGEVGTHAL